MPACKGGAAPLTWLAAHRHKGCACRGGMGRGSVADMACLARRCVELNESSLRPPCPLAWPSPRPTRVSLDMLVVMLVGPG